MSHLISFQLSEPRNRAPRGLEIASVVLSKSLSTKHPYLIDIYWSLIAYYMIETWADIKEELDTVLALKDLNLLGKR